MTERDERGNLVEVRLAEGEEHGTVAGTLLDLDAQRGITLAGPHTPAGTGWARLARGPELRETVRYRPEQLLGAWLVTTGRKVW